MALFRTNSAAISGLEALVIDVEVDLYAGVKQEFFTVGVPALAMHEGGKRIKSALISSGYGYPTRSVFIKLVRAGIREEWASFDLPIAIGILIAMGVVRQSQNHLFVGELSRNGELRPIRGALSIVASARSSGIRNLLLPADNATEVSGVDGVDVFGARNLTEAVQIVNAHDGLAPQALTERA